MKVWTYGEMMAKAILDLSLADEIFVTGDEMVGYFNEGIEDAAAEIIKIDEDYFLTKYFVPFLAGQSSYNLPDQIFANKIRGFMYINGSVIYPINRFRRRNKFENIALYNQYGQADDYMYYLTNDTVGQAQLQILPPARESAILAPANAQFTPAILWFLRNFIRVPKNAELCNLELIATSQVSAAADTIQTFAGTQTIGIPQQGQPGACPSSIPYITGDAVVFTPGPNGTLPAPLVAGVVYYVIAGANGLIKLATTKANALANTAIDLTTVGTVYHTMKVQATSAIISATLIDVPEFSTYLIQWAKVCCLGKESDPRISTEADKLVAQKKQMVDTLTGGIPDDDDKIEADYTHYQESN